MPGAAKGEDRRLGNASRGRDDGWSRGQRRISGARSGLRDLSHDVRPARIRMRSHAPPLTCLPEATVREHASSRGRRRLGTHPHKQIDRLSAGSTARSASGLRERSLRRWYRLHVSLPLVVIGVGAVLIVMTFLLAFTIFGEISAVAGIACVGGGAMMLRRCSPR